MNGFERPDQAACTRYAESGGQGDGQPREELEEVHPDDTGVCSRVKAGAPIVKHNGHLHDNKRTDEDVIG